MRFRSRPDASGSHAASRTSRALGAFAVGGFSALRGAQLPLALCLGTTLCGGALFVGPLAAAPLVDADENGPQVQILSPGYNDIIKGKFDITLSVKAGNYNPASIEMFVDDQSATGGTIPLQNLGTSFGWDTRKFMDGPHKLKVIVTDTQGFRGWAEVNVFINNNRVVDELPPSLSWLNVKSDMALSGRARIQLDAKDFFGVKLVKITVNSANEPNRNPAIATWLLNRPPYIVDFDTTRVPDGVYYLRANAWDSSEQQGIAPSLRIGVLNNALNTQTLGEQLQGLKALEQAIEQNNAPKTPGAKPLGTLADPRVVTLPPLGKIKERTEEYTPGAGNLSSAGQNYQGALNKGNENVAGQAPAVARPLVPSRPEIQTRDLPGQVSPVKTAPQTATGQFSPKKPLQIAEALPQSSNGESGALSTARLPETRASRDLLALARPEIGSQFAARAEVPGGNEREVEPLGQPSLSKGGAPLLASAKGIEGEVSPEFNRAVEARIAAPNAQNRVIVESATLSAARDSWKTAASSGLSVEVEADKTARTEIARLATPEGESRLVLDAATWSAQGMAQDGEIAGTPAPFQIEGPRAEGEIKVAAPGLMARAIPQTQAPAAFSASQVEAVRATIGAPVTHSAEQSVTPSKIAVPVAAAPTVKAETSPQLSVARPLETAPVGAKGALNAVRAKVGQVVAAKTPSKTSLQKMPTMPRVQVAALPKTNGASEAAITPSITVSPLSASVQQMPTAHRVERPTTLRAVAARYGLPVELVAACNNWPVEMNVVAGMTVELPRPMRVSYAGQPVVGDSHSMLVGGTGVTAFRFLFEQAGGKIEWDAQNKRVIARKGASEITLSIGSKVAKVGDKDVMMELAAFLFEGRTMVPVRLFEEGLRAQVEWDPQTGRMVVAMLADNASQG